MATEAHPMLATELLGYQPQLLLDELMNSLNETVYESVARVEEFLEAWIQEKEDAGYKDVEALRTELDQGMHSLQTLLEAHADLAFDFFEAWSHRNIFIIGADLPVVAPHHRGLDLQTPPEKEHELQIEVETLRRKLDNMRRRYARIRRIEAQAAYQRKKAEARLQSVSNLEATASETEKALPTLANFIDELRKLHDLPLPPKDAKAQTTKPTKDPQAYLRWAMERMMKESAMQTTTEAESGVVANMRNVGSRQMLAEGVQHIMEEEEDEEEVTSTSDDSSTDS